MNSIKEKWNNFMNTTINVIPKKERIKVYERALEIIENEEDVYELGKDYGLCILLRCIDSNLNSYKEDYDFRGIYWHCKETPNLYPEFKRYYNDEPRKFIELYESNIDVWRRVVLRLILEKMGVDTIKLDE